MVFVSEHNRRVVLLLHVLRRQCAVCSSKVLSVCSFQLRKQQLKSYMDYMQHSGASIWRSMDGGATWSVSNSIPSSWKAVATDSQGLHVAAVAYGGFIWVSEDSGQSWASTGPDSSMLWTSVAISADGSTLVATAANAG